MTARALTRVGDPRVAPRPVRIAHLGLGGFFRAHGAWYTAHAADAEEWGIVGFSHRSHDLVDRMVAQYGLYTLTTRGAARDTIEVVPSIMEAHPGSDTAAWRTVMADPATEVVTLTVTEAAYSLGPESVVDRVVDGLAARHAADAGPVTLVPCDNLAANGRLLEGRIRTMVARRSGDLADWIDESVAVLDTVVDRITPRATDADVVAAAAHGYLDAAPVVTEPFSEWILSGSFAAAHPDWESAGAVIVDDPGPFVRRKLHLLNGAHSLLAYAGLLRGHEEIASAAADPVLADAVETWWDEAAATVGGDPPALAAYRAALSERFGNAKLDHRLAQIAVDGSVKLAARVVPVARTERDSGRSAAAAAATIGAWIAYCRRVDDSLVDARRDEVLAAVRGRARTAIPRTVAVVDPDLADDDAFVRAVTEAVSRWRRSEPTTD